MAMTAGRISSTGMIAKQPVTKHSKEPSMTRPLSILLALLLIDELDLVFQQRERGGIGGDDDGHARQEHDDDEHGTSALVPRPPAPARPHPRANARTARAVPHYEYEMSSRLHRFASAL